MNIIYRCINKFRKTIFEKYYHEKVANKYRAQLENADFSLLCNNCLGGILYHDLGLEFKSPTINMYFKADDYIEFLENLDFYLSCDIKGGGEIPHEGGYIGVLNGKVKLYGIHYKSQDELIDKWNSRRTRVNKDNLFVIGSYRDDCNDELARRFCELPYPNKVFFSHKDLLYSDCVVLMPGCHGEAPAADKMKSCKLRAYDAVFDFVQWINNGIKR